MSSVEQRIRATADQSGWYGLSGERLYCVATRAGTFPDTGWHQPGEMGGVWAPPIKLLDGYWLALRQGDGEPRWLTTPDSWRLGPEGVTFHYDLPDLNLEVTRRDWIAPHASALVVDVTVRRTGSETFAPAPTWALGLGARSDLHSAWLGDEQLGLPDGPDAAYRRDDLGAVVFYDTLHPEWNVCVGADVAPASIALGANVALPEQTTGQGANALLWYALPGDQQSARRFVIAGPGDENADSAARFAHWTGGQRAETPSDGLPDTQAATRPGSSLLDQAHSRVIAGFRSAFDQCELRSPDAQVDAAFAWTKIANRALMLDVPGLGRAPMAGLADFPWWFGCDIAYGILPYLATGQGGDAVDALLTLTRLSARHNPNGRVLHEIIFNGATLGDGNLVETPLLARALYHTYRWTGDRRLLDEVFPFSVRGMLDWALGERREAGELAAQGESIVETPDAQSGVQTLDANAYLAEALELLAELALETDSTALSTDLRQRGRRLRRHLRRNWWVPTERFFGDTRASRAELEALLDRLRHIAAPDVSVALSVQRIERALAEDTRSLPPHVRKPWNFQYYTQALAAEAGIPTDAQAAALLDRLESPEWTEQYGLVLDAALDRRVMTLPTGALAIGEARYGRMDASLDYIRRIASTLGAMSPGAISEFSPVGGCFSQLWSSYGVIWPIVHHFFGLRPDVARRKLLCAPNLPAAWPFASLTGIPMGDTVVDVHVERLPEGYRVSLEIGDPSWEVTLGVASPDCPAGAVVNGRSMPLKHAGVGIRHANVAPSMRGAALYELVASQASGNGRESLAAGEQPSDTAN